MDTYSIARPFPKSIPFVSDGTLTRLYDSFMERGTWLDWGKRIRAHVALRELSWGSVADRMGVTEAGLRHWLNGTRDINLVDFFSLCGAIDADPSEMLFGRKIEVAQPALPARARVKGGR